MNLYEQELEYFKNFETGFLLKLEEKIKLTNDWYYQKLMQCKTDDIVLQNSILRELSEYKSKPSEERLQEVVDLYQYLQRTISVRNELTDGLASKQSEIDSLKQIVS